MNVFDELIDTLKSVNSGPGIWDELAKCYKNSYDALIRVGFTSEQAMDILKHQGSGLKPN